LNNFFSGNEEKVNNKRFFKLKVRHILGKKPIYSMKSSIVNAELIFVVQKMFKFRGTNFRGQAIICIFCGT